MGNVKTVDSVPFFFERQTAERVVFGAEDYKRRLDVLIARIREKGVSSVIIYGDREHFSNIEYFSSYDCRFEEALLIVTAEGRVSIIVGNEGMGYSYQIPYEIERYLYQNFSLQGQPRRDSEKLSVILKKAGVAGKTGVTGYKYFEEWQSDDALHLFDVPEYILDEIREAADADVINFTSELTNTVTGIRMRVRTAKEIAWAEYAGIKAANTMLNMLENLRPGIKEVDVQRKADADYAPVTMFGLTNFGDFHVSLGLRSSDDTKLKVGDVVGLCYAVRGSLCSRNGVAAYDEASYPEKLQGKLDDFYKPYWSAVATWLENVKEGAIAGDVYKQVMAIIGDPKFHVTLNCGHNTATDEWVNSPFYEGSDVILESGTYLQSDMIGSSPDPVMSAICEDTVIVAGKALRDELKTEYPDVYKRITDRQKVLREVIGINFDDSLLPMSNITGVYFPFMLDLGKVLAK